MNQQKERILDLVLEWRRALAAGRWDDAAEALSCLAVAADQYIIWDDPHNEGHWIVDV